MFTKEILVWFLTGAFVILLITTAIMTVVYEITFRGKVISKRDLRRPLFTLLTISGSAGLALGLLAVMASFVRVRLSLPEKMMANLALVVVCSLGTALLFGFTFLSTLSRAGHQLEDDAGEDIVQTLYTMLRKNIDE